MSIFVIYYLLHVPIIDIFFGATKFIPQAHPNNICGALKQSGHHGQAFDPKVRIEVLVTKESTTVELAATPTRLAYVIVQYRHYIILPKV